MTTTPLKDSLTRGLLAEPNIGFYVADVSGAAAEARSLHGLGRVSAMLLGEALCGGAMLAGLQKDSTRINLQLECDGPLRGLFVDATASGDVRGYVKNQLVSVEGAEGPFRWRPALGNSGFLSVLKNIGGDEYYRSQVALEAMELSADLTRYFHISDQVPTRVVIDVLATDDSISAAGVLVQTLPGGDARVLEAVGDALAQRFREVLVARHERQTPISADALLGPWSPAVMSTREVHYRCTCSLERVLDALSALGVDEIQDILKTQGQVSVQCQFCGRTQVATREHLTAIAQRLAQLPS